MLYFDDIKVEFESQEFKGTHIEISPNDKSVLFLASVRSTQSVRCLYCGRQRWTKWFQAAKESEIPALVRFAVQKEKRLPGLTAHVIYSISTGKLEGFNNKIKVAKRIGYGYRDDDFFFTLICYLSISSVRSPSHKKS